MSRKKSLMIQLIALICIFLLFCSIAAAMFTNGIGWLFMFTKFRNRNAERAAPQGEVSTFKGVKVIDIDTISYSIEVVEYSGSEVSVQEDTAGITFGIMSNNQLYQKGDTVYYKQGKGAGIDISRGGITVYVPENSVLQYKLNSVSGSIDLCVPSNYAKVSSVSGSIEIDGYGKELKADNTSGSIKVYEPFERIYAETVSGSVKLTVDKTSKEIEASAISGSIKIAFEEQVGFIMDYNSVSGSVKDEYEGLQYDKKGTVRKGDEQVQIEAETVSGSLKLTDWD